MPMKLLSFEKMKYYLYLPDNFDESKKYPVILFLHGAGERQSYEKVLVQGPLSEIKNGMKLDFVIIYPCCEGLNTWFNYFERLNRLLVKYEKCDYIDNNRIYITGLSMGGYGTLNMSMAYPNHFAAIAALCGGGMNWNSYMIKDIPTLLIHGDKDDSVDVGESIRMYEKLKSYGGNVSLKIMEGYGHNVWTDTYNKKEFYDWLLSNSKK